MESQRSSSAPVITATPTNHQPISDVVLQQRLALVAGLEKQLEEIRSLVWSSVNCSSSTILQPERRLSPSPQQSPACPHGHNLVDGVSIGPSGSPHAPSRVNTVETCSASVFRRPERHLLVGPVAVDPPSSDDRTEPISSVRLPPDRDPELHQFPPPSAADSRRPAQPQVSGPPATSSPRHGAAPPSLDVGRPASESQQAPPPAASGFVASSSDLRQPPAIQAAGISGVDSPDLALPSRTISAAVSADDSRPPPHTAVFPHVDQVLTGQQYSQLFAHQSQALTSQLQSPLTSQLQSSPVLTSSDPDPIFTDSTTVSSRAVLNNTSSGPSFKNILMGASDRSRPKCFNDAPTPIRKGDLMTISISDSIYTARLRLFDTALLGKLILRPGDKPVSYADLRSQLQSFWNPSGDWRMTSLGKGYYSFKFASIVERDRIRSFQLPSLKPGTLRLFSWTPGFNPNEHRTTSVQVWVRFAGLSEELYDKSILWGLAKCIGTPLKIDPRSLDGKFAHYARVLVEVDVSQQVHSKVGIQHGDVLIVSIVTYERLPEYCHTCMAIGHSFGSCRKLQRQQKYSDPPTADASQPVSQFAPVPAKQQPSVSASQQVWQEVPKNKAAKRTTVPVSSVLHNILNLTIPPDEALPSSPTKLSVLAEPPSVNPRWSEMVDESDASFTDEDIIVDNLDQPWFTAAIPDGVPFVECRDDTVEIRTSVPHIVSGNSAQASPYTPDVSFLRANSEISARPHTKLNSRRRKKAKEKALQLALPLDP